MEGNKGSIGPFAMAKRMTAFCALKPSRVAALRDRSSKFAMFCLHRSMPASGGP
jgi:hypothetical protein